LSSGVIAATWFFNLNDFCAKVSQYLGTEWSGNKIAGFHNFYAI
jgi:hypothetical protein